LSLSFSASEASNDLPISGQLVKQLSEDDVDKPGYILFTHKDTGINLQVAQQLTIKEDYTFTLLDSTQVRELSNPYSSRPLDQILPLPQLVIERGGLNVVKNTTVNLGKTITTSPKRNDFIVSNKGNGKLILIGDQPIKISGDGADVFSVGQLLTSEIAPNTSLGFRINFKPPKESQTQTYNATVTINSNDKNGDFTFTITAIGDGSKTCYVIGDEGQAGGIIFYDKGKDAYSTGDWRYLEAAPESTEFSAEWGTSYYDVTGTEKDIGTGKRNTELIAAVLKQRGETGKAAQRCNDMTFGGHNDWFLPSMNELDLIRKELKQGSFGAFKDGWYWSSSQYDDAIAWGHWFVYDFVNGGYKSSTCLVRAVRAF